jgi:mannose-6-phosphate isomerase-like protein (cupin superfamily)
MKKAFRYGAALAIMAAFAVQPGAAQQGEGPRGPLQQWWVYKGSPGIYTPPNRPLWKLSDLLRAHSGQNNWSEVIVRNPQQEGTYNSAAPGTSVPTRMHVDTNALFIVVRGEMHFTVEGQPPVTATRGSEVNIPHTTLYFYQVAGSQNALWVEVHPAEYKTVYPVEGAQPPAMPGNSIVKVAFNHTPGTFVPPNQVHWNLFEAAAACAPLGVHVDEAGLYTSAIAGYAMANDPSNKCNMRVSVPPPDDTQPFNKNSTFGHMHAGMSEWWVIQSGHMHGRIENAGEFQAEEGDVMYAPQSSWHSQTFEGPGMSERLAIAPFAFNNMNNTGGD